MPEATCERILAQKEPEQLQRWLKKASVATSLADVLEEPGRDRRPPSCDEGVATLGLGARSVEPRLPGTDRCSDNNVDREPGCQIGPRARMDSAGSAQKRPPLRPVFRSFS